jgi:hypothetical protein
LLLVLYGYENRTVTLKQGHRPTLKTSEKIMIGRMFGTEGAEVEGGKRKLRTEGLYSFYGLPYIIRVTISPYFVRVTSPDIVRVTISPYFVRVTSPDIISVTISQYFVRVTSSDIIRVTISPYIIRLSI